MKAFAEAYPFVQLLTAEFQSMEIFLKNIFFNIGFTQHLLLLNRCKEARERLFYMQKAANLQWTVSVLEHQIVSGLYHQQGGLQHNFETTLPPKLHKHAVDAFKGEYLLDFIRMEEEDDERVLENKIFQLDEYVKQDHENPSIGIVLCKSKNTKVVEFVFRDFNKAMGVATFKPSQELPANYKGILPDSEELKKY